MARRKCLDVCMAKLSRIFVDEYSKDRRRACLLSFLKRCKSLYFVSVCARQESNLRPSGPQPDALSTELRAQKHELRLCIKQQPSGYQPGAPRLPAGRYPLSYELATSFKYAGNERVCQQSSARILFLLQRGEGRLGQWLGSWIRGVHGRKQ